MEYELQYNSYWRLRDFFKIIKKKAIIDQNITIKGVSKVYREFFMKKRN